MAYQPQVLLMDEPFAAVDAQTRADLEDLIRSVYLGERVLVLSGSPTVVQDELVIDLPADRDQLGTRSMPHFTELRGHMYSHPKEPEREGRGGAGAFLQLRQVPGRTLEVLPRAFVRAGGCSRYEGRRLEGETGDGQVP